MIIVWGNGKYPSFQDFDKPHHFCLAVIAVDGRQAERKDDLSEGIFRDTLASPLKINLITMFPGCRANTPVQRR
jgi:hypothetical protein